MIFPRSIATAMLFGGVLLLGACSSSDSDSGNGDAEKIAAARSAAISSISNNIEASVDSLDTVVSNSTTTDIVIDTGVGDVSAPTVIGQTITAQTTSFIQKFSGSNNTFLPMTSHEAETSISTGIEEQLSEFMSSGIVDGDVIVYRPNIDAACVDAEDVELCREFWEHVSVEQRVISDTEGTLTFKFDSNGPFVIGYTSNSVYFEIILSELNNAYVTAADLLPPDFAEIPSSPSNMYQTFEGTIRLTITKLGEEHGSITLSIPQAINIDGIGGIVNALSNRLEIARTSKVFEIVANANTNEATISFGLRSVYALWGVEAFDDPNTTLPLEFKLDAFEGLFAFSSNNGTDTLVASGVGLGNLPMTLEVGNTEALNVSMNTLGFTVDGNQQTVTLDTGLDFNFAVTNVNAVFADLFDSNQTNTTDTSLQGSLGFTAPAATVFTDLGVPANDLLGNNITEVTQGGPFAVTGTGYFLGDATVNQSQCFTEPTDGNFPIIIVDCPATQ